MKPPITGHDAISRDDMLVHSWRVSPLARLGVPGHWPRSTPTARLASGRPAGAVPAAACPAHRPL